MSVNPAKPVQFDRTYDAALEDLWDLWTTKEGFESWWGPEGFCVEVHELDPREGGVLFYDMIACGAEQIAYMKQANMPVSHETRATFAEIEPMKRLTLRHMIDFVPGIEPYENCMRVEFTPLEAGVRMLISIDPHSTLEWTTAATAGMESQLTKLPAVLSARRR